MERVSAKGFIVHAYTDRRRGSEQVVGRLEDGRSFAASFPSLPREAFIPGSSIPALSRAGTAAGVKASAVPSPWKTFSGEPALALAGPSGKPLRTGDLDALARAGLPVHREGLRGAAAFLARRGIRGGIRIEGTCRGGRNVDLVFVDAAMEAEHDARVPLTVVSLDIETAEPAGTVLAVGLSSFSFPPGGGNARRLSERILFFGDFAGPVPPDIPLEAYPSERDLLDGLTCSVGAMDPDILTGWNVIDFDFPRLAAAYRRNGVPFALGRSTEEGIFFPSEDTPGGDAGRGRRGSASVFLPGRQVLDALRLVRTGEWGHESHTLDAVARETLGRGKTVESEGGDKLAELDRLYREDPASFCRYCLNDARLVNEILERKELIVHTVERSALTGAGLDKAWTSVASFERIYAEGLFSRGILEPDADPERDVSGAAGGTVLDPMAGLFGSVAVFDFRSLYPSVMKTFNVDPLAYELARGAKPDGGLIRAPNGASFVREGGILPALIERYFSERLAAIDRGDDASAYVYKILMNSFYGVLGTPKCRYARTELAGAVTSFGKWCLLFARDFFAALGYRVLYGDTDSVFVEYGEAGPEAGDAAGIAGHSVALATRLNEALAERVRAEWALESFISIRFEKLYLRFFIPHLRGPETGTDARGRAKGYAGLRLLDDGSAETEIKGMEAVRSDYTPFARRFQRELLSIVFSSPDTGAAEDYVRDQAEGLYRGDFDGELVFRKRLRRAPEDYVASTPPHIKVARSLGWTGRRGTVEYVITENGPEALSLADGRIDRSWYAGSQLLPVARAIGQAAGFDADALLASIHPDGQLEFEY